MKPDVSTAAMAVLIPGPDHPITIEPNAHQVVVTVAGRVVADTRAALTLREASYPAVHYIPRKDVDTALLERTDHATYCPYEGDCTYYSIPLGGKRSVDAVWGTLCCGRRDHGPRRFLSRPCGRHRGTTEWLAGPGRSEGRRPTERAPTGFCTRNQRGEDL